MISKAGITFGKDTRHPCNDREVIATQQDNAHNTGLSGKICRNAVFHTKYSDKTIKILSISSEQVMYLYAVYRGSIKQDAVFISNSSFYLVSFDEHEAHDEVFADVLRLGQTNPLHEPRFLLLTVLQELEELERPLEGGPPHLRQVVNAAIQHVKSIALLTSAVRILESNRIVTSVFDSIQSEHNYSKYTREYKRMMSQ